MKARKSIILIIILLAALVAGFFVFSNRSAKEQNQKVNFKLQPTKSINDSYINPAKNVKNDKKTKGVFLPGGTTGSETEASPGYISGDEEINILVDTPEQGDVLSSPFVVSGEARVFENVLIVQVTNQTGKALIKETVKAHPADVGQFGPFKITLSYSFSQTKEGFVEVYSESARDGSKQNLVKIPVKFE